ncbi:MAG TPA: polysaccharide biosynthesis/export family protein [Paracoccaceae bacterium]|nr:polysaccharide biosynthesis/export family protein [Paracoccaceae bacterium]
MAGLARAAWARAGLARACLMLAGLALAACTPAPALDRARLSDDGVVQRMAVTAPATARGTGPRCGRTALPPGRKEGGTARGVSYLVGPGDNLRFNIFGEEGMSDLTARVDDAGFVQLPIIELVRVGGKSTREIQAELKTAYAAEFLEPWVTVELVEAESAPIYFVGEFREPGVRYMSGATNVLEAIALAGGLEEDAYLPGARLMRGDHTCTVDLHALLRNGAFDQNIWIQPHDVIFAPRREDMSVYVLGAVASPQAVPFGADGRTLVQALSVAGGPVAGQSFLSEVRVIRAASPTRGELIVVDAAAMLAGRGLDFALEPGDVVFVPRSAMGEWNGALAQILPSLQVLGGVLTPITLIESLSGN